ncbi:glycoside hydrolase family 99-like domain-containing protein [Vibrio splendidus]|uniref:glycosyltransferase WbsX family protein n=1 Tax=Vibrio splendidus TaxID=29497 RepID=UPI000D3D45C9|nr:glycoside hydrolase family 99-like domain-containing protein [Vibrio splendidus]PTO68215.1 hypothetical protein CWN81_20525 [Vibrio splendidus]PTP81869.1 hypothetical protein CWO03_22740 [Vibrio splendidus]
MKKLKVYPFYFPQLYAIPENDTWWGEGFTDWKLVKESTPLFSGHFQPRVPKLGYLNQSMPKTIKTQCELAKEYGISGFNFYHYWFDGKVLLDSPARNLLNDTSIDFEYFFTWANENWTKQWVGDAQTLLIKNSYTRSEELWEQHFSYLLNFFRDKRYVKVDNKPIFCIYRPEIILNLEEFIDFFNKRALDSGFDGLHFIAMRAYEIYNPESVYKKFDAIVNFQPRYAVNKYLSKRSASVKKLESIARTLPEKWQAVIANVMKRNSYTTYSYTDYLATLDKSSDLKFLDKTCYQAIFPDWDNTARYNQRATFFSDVSLAGFKYALDVAATNVESDSERFLFVNAWNEWSEGAYLEPDEKFGFEKLEAIKELVIKTENK